MVGQALDLTKLGNCWRSTLKPFSAALCGFPVISVVKEITAERTEELMLNC